MSANAEPDRPKVPSYLWPILAWGFLALQVYYDLPKHRAVVDAVGATMPESSRRLHDNLAWMLPALLVATGLLAWMLRPPILRWLVLMLIPIVCIFGLLLLRVQTTIIYMSPTPP